MVFFEKNYPFNGVFCRCSLHYEKFQDGTVKCIENEIPFEVPEGWEWCRLNDIYNFIDYRGATPTKISKGIPLITAKNVKSGYIDYAVDDYISEEEYKERQQRGVSRKGDILFTTEAPLGNAALADICKFSAGQRLITFQHYGIRNELINYVMLMFILSDFFQHQLYVNKTGSTVAGIKASILKTLWIPIPPYKEQVRISNILKSAIYLIDNISEKEKILSEIINKAKSKILDLAIRGKLVPQDPSDEPASVLLERIRAEKEELIKQGKIKRDKKESIIFKGVDNSYYETIDNKTICIDEEIPFVLPDGWIWCRLKSLAAPRENSFVDGPFGSNLKTDHYTENREVRIIQLNNIGEFTWKNSGIKYTTFKHAELLERCKSYPGDIVIAKMMPAGRTIIIPSIEDVYVISSDCVRLQLPEYIHSEFIMFMINSPIINKCILKDVQGIGRTRTSLGKLKDLLVPLPPYNQQLFIATVFKKVLKKFDTINNLAE